MKRYLISVYKLEQVGDTCIEIKTKKYATYLCCAFDEDDAKQHILKYFDIPNNVTFEITEVQDHIYYEIKGF
jgi:hypothetical protein